MSKSYWAERNEAIEAEWDRERAYAQQESVDVQTLQRAKELLTDLWKQGRVHIDVRMQGENALSAALHAVENPGWRNITLHQGMQFANQQWLREQEAKNRDC